MSGVKNLRAMFEQKGGDSPPDRGRSPPGSAPGSVKLVRMNFVAIEKDGRIGLQRDPSRESVSLSSRRPSNETESTTPAAVSEKSDVFADSMAQNVAAFKTNLANEPIPESSPLQTTPPSRFSPKMRGPRTPEIVPNSNPDKITDEEESKTKLTPGDPTTATAAQNNEASKPATNGATKNGSPTSKVKISPISTTGRAASKGPKSPEAAHAPKTDKAKGSSVRGSSAKPTTPQKSTFPTKKPAALDLSPPSVTGFVKPKVKSPTRPAKLPASLTTHTAASAQKTGAQAPAAAPARQTLSRTSGNHLAPNHGAEPRPRSRNSATATTTAAPKTLKRQSSTINRPRPSIGPPPSPWLRTTPDRQAHGIDQGQGQPGLQEAGSNEGARSQSPATLGEGVAPVAAQATSAETAIEAAAVSKDTAVTPVVEKSEPQAVEAVVEAATAAASDKEAQESKETAEQTKLTNGANGTTASAVSANPKEVKDVEDVVQEAPASKSEDSTTLAPAAEITPAKTEGVSAAAEEQETY
ncbi:hypothetical protein PG997_010232 [Apiospora hydei]|uniref:Mucin-7 n=1 Tax=Apiospora hydei TaxID=1337664 RepID=A0ABR1VWG6_9PEZI